MWLNDKGVWVKFNNSYGAVIPHVYYELKLEKALSLPACHAAFIAAFFGCHGGSNDSCGGAFLYNGHQGFFKPAPA